MVTGMKTGREPASAGSNVAPGHVNEAFRELVALHARRHKVGEKT